MYLVVDIYYRDDYCNSYLIYNDKLEAILVDPGYDGEKLIEHIKKLNLVVKSILLTHCHYDHIGALEEIFNYFDKPKVYVHELEFDSISNPRINLSRFNKVLNFIPSNIEKVVDKEIIHINGFDIEVLHTPFHTSGSCCFYIESEKAIFTGDTLFKSSIGRSDLPTGCSKISQIKASLDKIKRLPLDTKIYPGHGSISTLKREMDFNPYLRNV